MKATRALFENYAFEKRQFTITIDKLEECLEAAEKINHMDRKHLNSTKAQG